MEAGGLGGWGGGGQGRGVGILGLDSVTTSAANTLKLYPFSLL